MQWVYIGRKDKVSLLLKACLFHYEIEFIHPFVDGNGRIGRLWQQLMLMSFHPVFEFICVESLIKEHQSEYYRILGVCDKKGESTLFLEFMLGLIFEALADFYSKATCLSASKEHRLAQFQEKFTGAWFTRQDYILFHKTISPATASRDLQFALSNNDLEKSGDKRTTRYRFL